MYPEIGPNVQFPVAACHGATRTPLRRPAPEGRARIPRREWRCGEARRRLIASWASTRAGSTAIVVVDAQGNIIEDVDAVGQACSGARTPSISAPTIAQKHVWVVDDNTQAIYKFTNDGKQLVQTIGTPNVPGADATHFNRPTFIAWLPDGTFFVSDGYNGTRVAKFDKNGKFLMDWGIKGDPRQGNAARLHEQRARRRRRSVETRRVFVNDRDNHRIQIFDENGKYLSEWRIDVRPVEPALRLDRRRPERLVTFDRSTHKMLKYDHEGHLLYAWGTLGDFPGTLWGVHGMSTDQEGNLYVAEVDTGRFQKFRPRAGANPAT